MTCSAVFDSLRRLFEQAAELEPTAKAIASHVDIQKKSGSSWEGWMLDKIRSDKLLNPDTITALSRIYSFRNQAAHPSENDPSERDARYIYETAVDHFLGRVLELPSLVMEDIVCGLSHESYFLDLTLDAVIRKVSEELSRLEQRNWPVLIDKLVKIAEASAGDTTAADNASSFLGGMLHVESPKTIDWIYRRAFKRSRFFDRNRHAYLADLLCSRPEMMRLFKGDERTTLDTLLASNISVRPDRDALWLLESMFEEFKNEEFTSHTHGFDLTVSAIVQRHWTDPRVINGLKKGLYRLIVDTLLLKFRTADTKEEGAIANLLISLDSEIADGTTGSDAFEFVKALCSDRFDGPVKALRDSHFEKIPRIRKLAHDYARDVRNADLSLWRLDSKN
jgi:hypothetical protein